MIKNMKKYGYIAFVLCVLAGCASQKQISYLQDVPDDYRQKITQDRTGYWGIWWTKREISTFRSWELLKYGE